MTKPPLFIDATFFLGMHAADPARRLQSLAYFTQHLDGCPRMNYEQIGICDAIIWGCGREVQDQYYPFMDRLHTDMAIQRGGYTRDEIGFSLSHPELAHLSAVQALLVAQVLRSDALLASHDSALHALDCLHGRIWQAQAPLTRSPFPEPLQTLYDASTVFRYYLDDFPDGEVRQ